MEINKINEQNFLDYKSKHTSEGGSSPDTYALTQLIKDSLVNKDYIIYNGGGPQDESNELFLKKFDVVLTFTWGSDPDFMVVFDDDGDFCDLYCSDRSGNLLKKCY